MPLGGLEALVAAASAAKQASGSEKRARKQRKGKDDQPAVQVSASSDILEYMRLARTSES